MPNRLLLADEDPQTLRVLEVSLRGAGFDVTSVTTGAAAWVAMEEELPQVVLAATNLAALDGFELCTRLRARPGGREVAFLLLGDEDSLALRVKSIEAGADDYLLKPPYVQEVVARVRALVQRRDRETFTASARAAEAFTGQLADLSVVDLLQVLADSRRSGIVHLRGARETPATIYFRQGQIVDAEAGRLSGINAISRLFSWSDGSFEVHWKPIRRPNAIGLATPELILEGMKRLDERNRLAGGLPDLNAVFEVNYRVLAERLSEIPDEVNAVLRLFDGSRTLAHVVDDCQLPDPEAMAIAIRLRDEGIIHNVSHPAAETSDRLVVPPRTGRAPSPDDVTVVRRITSLGTGSGPVQQAFAATETAPDHGVSSAETVVGPAPSAPVSFDDVDGVVSPDNHAKTDPGLGQPLALPDPDPGGLSPDRAVIPMDDVPSARPAQSADGAEVTAPNADPASTELPPGHAESPFAGAEPLPAGVGLDADPSTLQTQRGLGPFPELFQSQATSNGEAASLPAGSFDADDAQATRPIELEPAPAAPGVAPSVASLDAPEPSVTSLDAPEPSVTSLDAPEPSPAAELPGPDPDSLRPPVTASGEKPVPVTLAEGELSDKEARDELGVSSGGRGLRIVAVLAVAGALAAVMIHKLRSGPVASTASPAASAPGTASGAGEPSPPPALADNQPAPTPSSGGDIGAPGTPSAAPEGVKPGAAMAGKGTAVPAAADGGEGASPSATAPVGPDVAAAPTGVALGTEKSGAGSAGKPAATGERPAGNTAPAENAVAGPVPARPAAPGSAAPEPPSGKAAPLVPAVSATGLGHAASPEKPGTASATAPASFARTLATCRSQFLHDRIREAAATCAAALEANPNSADALTMMAHVELNRGHLGRANELAQRSIAIDPNQADAYVIIGGVHQDSGRNAQAKVSYRRYLQLAPHGRYADEVRSIVGSL